MVNIDVMALVYNVFMGIIGLIFLIGGAEIVVFSAKRIAKKLGLSDFFVGLTLLSILTSLPEITEHVVASIDILNKPALAKVLAGVALGTNIGSNIVQITLIVGIVGLFGKLLCDDKFLKRDYLYMLFSIIILFLFSLTNKFISRIEGGVLIIMYLFYVLWLSKDEKLSLKFKNKKRKSISSELVFSVVGFLVLLFGAQQILVQGVFFSEYFKISGTFIGTMIIGIATALPELATALVALKNKSSGLSLGTLIGSNITNPLFALGLGALISGYHVANSLLWFSLPFWFFISVIGFFLFWFGKYLSKKQALVLIAGYLVYAVINIKFFI